MTADHLNGDAFRRVARPLLMTVITTLRPDLHPAATGMAVEELVLELDALEDGTYWETVQGILDRLIHE